MSLIAVFIALGGTGYAAVTLPKNSVGSKQLKSNAVTGAKVKNGSLRAGDFRAGDLPAGPQGVQGVPGATGATGAAGPTGPQGTPGVAAAYARIDETGALIGGAAQNKGIDATDIQHDAGASTAETTGPGVYCFGDLGFNPTSAVVSVDNTDAMPGIGVNTGGSLNFIATVAVFKGEDLGRCNNGHGQARVAIQAVDQTTAPTLTNHGFFIWFEK